VNGTYLLPGAEFFVAIDNKGLWPNLTLLPNGEIAAAVYNHPSHGFGCGDVECWVSADQGRTWGFRSKITDHSEDPKLTRMNHAVGLNQDGHLVALVSGWSEGRKPPALPVQKCVSKDDGLTWDRSLLDVYAIPYGDIITTDDDSLYCAAYGKNRPVDTDYAAFLYESVDHGLTWRRKATISDNATESALMRLASGRYMTAARTHGGDAEIGESVSVMISSDSGETWEKQRQMSLPMQHPAHLARLSDHAILLTYGSRINGIYGVVMRISRDNGETWTNPRTLISMAERSDCGYPSSVQLADGTIVTAYYFGPKMTAAKFPNGLPWHRNYHMGIARWSLNEDTFENQEVPWIVNY